MHNDDIDTHSEPVPEVRPPFSLLASALPPRHSDRGGLAPAARAQARARSAGARIGRARRVFFVAGRFLFAPSRGEASLSPSRAAPPHPLPVAGLAGPHTGCVGEFVTGRLPVAVVLGVGDGVNG